MALSQWGDRVVPGPAQHLPPRSGQLDAMPDSDVLQTREALLGKAAQAWLDDPALDCAVLGEGDSVLCYLRGYYRRIATEDLPSPSRLAAVAEAHAKLGLLRP